MNSDQSTPATGYLDADRPIERGDEDRLDRAVLRRSDHETDHSHFI